MFGTVTKVDRFFKALPVPFFMGDGSALYPFATGLKIALSKLWFNEKVNLFKGSKQYFET